VPRQRHLTIVHVSNFPTGVRPAARHTVEMALSNGLVRNGHLVLNFSDRSVAKAKAPFGGRALGRGAVNRALLDFCDAHRPDLILFGHADLIAAETLVRLRERHASAKIAQWNVDALFTPANVARIRAKAKLVDLTFVTTAGRALQSLAADAPTVYLPNPVDPSLEPGRNFEQADLPFDLFFACGDAARHTRQLGGEDWSMETLFSRIKAALPDRRFLLPGLSGAPTLQGKAYQAALESAALGLNISRRSDHYLYSSDRLAHYVGNGLGVVIERTTGFDDLFEDEAFVFFSGLDELIDKVGRLSRDAAARRALARAGFERYAAWFSDQAVAAYMVEQIFGELDEARHAWVPLVRDGQARRLADPKHPW
jgi:hypothetical protein